MIYSTSISRRSFLSASAAATAGILSSKNAYSQMATLSSNEFRFAQIGAGGRGRSVLKNLLNAGGRLVALCDVCSVHAKEAYEFFPDLPKFTDYRIMLDQMEKEVDGVVICTPDHTHAVAALDAMRRGKHVYVEKPLARTFEECQLLLEAARKYKVVTQMGNQGHSGVGLKLWKKMFESQAFGDILEVHAWSSRPIWKQGMTSLPPETPVPEGMDWDSWIGPAAMRPFSPDYAPFVWRGWWDFGCGAMGDMAVHNMDPAFEILQWRLPSSVKAEVSAPAGLAYPEWSIVEFTFPATSVCPAGIKLTWHDGTKRPATPQGCHPALDIGEEGCLIIGSKMTALGGSHAGVPKPISLGGKEFGVEVKKAEKFWRNEHLKMTEDNHFAQWVEACKAHDATKAGSNFEYSAPFTQAVLLGCVALRFPGQELVWDAKKRCFSNHEEANTWLASKPRDGYNLNI